MMVQIQMGARGGYGAVPHPLPYVLGNALALAAGLLAAYVALLASRAVNPALLSTNLSDFAVYYSAAHLTLTGHAGAIYQLHSIAVQEARLAGYHTVTTVVPFSYPPYFALLLAPLALLPFGPAYLLWFLGNAVLVVAVLYHLERVSGLHGRPAVIFRLAALAFPPTFLTLGLGQVAIVLLALFTAATLWAVRQHDVATGACLALALLKPQYVLPFLVVLAARRRWRALAAFATGAGCLLLLPLPVSGVSADFAFLHLLAVINGLQGHGQLIAVDGLQVAPGLYAPVWNQSVAAMLEALLPAGLARTTFPLVILASLAGVGYCASRARSIVPPLALAAVAALLVSPHTLDYDLAVLLFPAAVLLRRPVRFLGPGLLLGALLLTIGFPLAFISPLRLSVLVMLALAWLLAWDCCQTRGGLVA